jgi:hypothetical protein
MAVPIRIIATEADGSVRTLLGCTLDASSVGARLGGVYETLEVGQIVTLQYRHRRCPYLVRWVGERGSANATQIGLECLEPGKNIWGVEFSDRIMPGSAVLMRRVYGYGDAS